MKVDYPPHAVHAERRRKEIKENFQKLGSEGRGLRAEVRSLKAEVRSLKSEVKIRKSDV